MCYDNNNCRCQCEAQELDSPRANTLDEMLEVITALKEGKMIECRSLPKPYRSAGMYIHDWRALPDLRTPQFGNCQYRVKRVPRTIWVEELSNGNLGVHNLMSEATVQAELKAGKKMRKFVEVLE